MTKYKTSKQEHVRAEEAGETINSCGVWAVDGTWTETLVLDLCR